MILAIGFAFLPPAVAILARAWLKERAARRRERAESERRHEETLRRHERERTQATRAAVRAAVDLFNRQLDGHETEARRPAAGERAVSVYPNGCGHVPRPFTCGGCMLELDGL